MKNREIEALEYLLDQANNRLALCMCKYRSSKESEDFKDIENGFYAVREFNSIIYALEECNKLLSKVLE